MNKRKHALPVQAAASALAITVILTFGAIRIQDHAPRVSIRSDEALARASKIDTVASPTVPKHKTGSLHFEIFDGNWILARDDARYLRQLHYRRNAVAAYEWWLTPVGISPEIGPSGDMITVSNSLMQTFSLITVERENLPYFIGESDGDFDLLKQYCEKNVASAP